MAPRTSDHDIAVYAFAAGFTGKDLPIAVAVALAESTGNPYAINVNVNQSTDYGLWQINTVNGDALALGDWRKPADNARMARKVWKRQGWQAWVTYNRSTYERFMGRGIAAASVVQPIESGFRLERMLFLAHPFEQGSDVAALQRLIGAKPVDGVFGPITEGFLKAWQKRNGQVMDGIFGPMCCKAAGWNYVGPV